MHRERRKPSVRTVGKGLLMTVLAVGLATPGCQREPAKSDVGRTYPQNLKFMGTAVTGYARDYQGNLPTGQVGSGAPKDIMPYVMSSALNCPESNTPYEWNTALNGKNTSSLAPNTWAFRCSKPHADGSVWAAFSDGHVAQLSGR